jgi:transcriptional regulator with XRE-family HTH domain
MPETFGARLRRRREERGVALLTIAQQTKIKASLLEGLEKDDLSQWPSSVYRRAFVRAYARAVDLDPEVVVQEFLQAHPDPPEVDVLAAMASALDRSDGHPRRASGFRRVVGSAFESLARRPRAAVGENPAGSLISNAPPTVVEPVPPPHATSSGPTNGNGSVSAPADGDGSLSADEPRPESPAVEAPVHVAPPAAPEPDLPSIACLCTEFGRVAHLTDVEPLLQRAAELLDAKGLIVWLWDDSAAHLTPALVYGYSDKVVSQLPRVGHDADNPTAAAFRSAESRICGDGPDACGALVVPLLTPAGCAGVLAIELQRGREGTSSAVAVATILAAQIAPLSSRMGAVTFASAVHLGPRGVPQAV